MLIMVEKGIRGGICHSVYWYAKAYNKYMKYYDKNRESSYLPYWEVNNLDLDFIKIMKKVMKDIFLKLMFNILKNYVNFVMI